MIPAAVSALRIIPARAGFTHQMSPMGESPRDHPRSRGVYAGSGLPLAGFGGSSPLARGLRPSDPDRDYTERIIPARAGFTRRGPVAPSAEPDHPRSRGVYQGRLRSGYPSRGSSPLARGLRFDGEECVPGVGIIPARAGFTARRTRARRSRADHPRSRGVYKTATEKDTWPPGSSPLARGLHSGDGPVEWAGRIIPARAGFTRTRAACARPGQDHPRSRGVYTCGSLESQR